jgi:hypothetical protein
MKGSRLEPCNDDAPWRVGRTGDKERATLRRQATLGRTAVPPGVR